MSKIIFKRGDKVNYHPDAESAKKLKAVRGTYIWAVGRGYYIIQHPDGSRRQLLPDDVMAKQLKDGLLYISALGSELELFAEKSVPSKIAPTKEGSKKKIAVNAVAKKAAPKQLNISQSLIKSLYDYQEGKLCGLQFEAQYIKKISFPPSAVQKLGNYFEYLCTGAIPRDGIIPEPERKKDKIEKTIINGKRLKNGKRAKNKVKKKIVEGELTAPYARMVIQAGRFKKAIRAHGIKIIKTGVELKYQDKKGIADILAEVDGEQALIDIKSTGLIGNRYEEIGWDVDALPEKDKIMIQPTFYKWLWRKLYGKDIPFYFMVFSNTNEFDCLFLKVVIDEERFQQIEKAFKKTKEMLDRYMTEGFKAYPDVKECADCPINKTCKSFTDIPLLQTVHY